MKKYGFVLLLIPLFYFPCYISDELVRELTKEDGLYEYAGAFLFFFTSIAFFILATKPNVFRAHKGSNKLPDRRYFWLLGLLFFFAFGEEISWGQRIFNFETPEAIKEMNIQGEFNFHNLKFFHGKTPEGEEKTGIMALLSMHRLFYLAFFTYLLVLPLLYKANSRIRGLADKLKLPVPLVIIGVLFIFNLAYGNTLRELLPEIDDHGIVEIKEFLMALILFLLPLSWMRFKKTNKEITE
ncbi:MAG: hypothetical protein AB3N14_17235 [Flavobacteriaceae bacterium]